MRKPINIHTSSSRIPIHIENLLNGFYYLVLTDNKENRSTLHITKTKNEIVTEYGLEKNELEGNSIHINMK